MEKRPMGSSANKACDPCRAPPQVTVAWICISHDTLRGMRVGFKEKK